MTLYEYYLIFPNGEKREINRPIGISGLVDMNGNQLSLPLPTNKMIAYQIAGKRTIEERGVVIILYMLQQLNANELLNYI